MHQQGFGCKLDILKTTFLYTNNNEKLDKKHSTSPK